MINFSTLNGTGLSFNGTLISELSASVQDIFENLNNGSILSALSALNALSGLPLSSAPMHPYDELKYSIYGPDYKDLKFKTLDDIPAPVDFVPEQMLQAVMDKAQTIQKTLLQNLDNDPKLFTNTVLNTVSGDQIIPNIDKYKKHIEFIELARQMPIDSQLSTEQLLDYAKKIISEYIKTY